MGTLVATLVQIVPGGGAGRNLRVLREGWELLTGCAGLGRRGSSQEEVRQWFAHCTIVRES